MNFSQITNKFSRRVGIGLLFMGLVGGATVPYYHDFFTKSDKLSTSQVPILSSSPSQSSTTASIAPIVEQTNTVIGRKFVQNKQVSNNTILTNTTTDIVDTRNGDPLAAERAAWEKMVNEHKYSNRPAYNKQDWKKLGLPRADRPDWAFEQDFLRTMNPATGEVPLQTKDIANQYAKEYWERPQVQAAIPITWTERGPNNIGGRTRAVMFDPNDATKKKVWAGGAGGGLWFTNDITTNSGWTKVDDLWDNIAISCIAYDPSNTQVFYVGTGEAYGGGVRGAGIWRTTNGGTTWARMAGTDPTADDFNFIQKIVVRANGEVLATTRGLFTNTGGLMKFDGTNWTKVLAPMTGTGLAAADGDMVRDWGCDIEIAANGDIYASMGFNTFGKVYKSTNGGTNWTALPNATAGATNQTRIELAVAPSNSNVIYAVAQNSAGGNQDVAMLRKSTDGGATWSNLPIPVTRDQPANGCGLTTDHFTRAQAFWDLTIAVHPTNPNLVLLAGIDAHRSTDGGATWNDISLWISRTPAQNCNKGYIHADIHNAIFRPNNTNEVVFASDGGLDYSPNAGDVGTATPTMESRITNYNVTQFYSGDIAATAGSNLIIGGTQDNGTLLTNGTGIQAATSPSGGDGGYSFISKTNANIRISSYTNCNYYRTNAGDVANFEEITSASPLKGNGSFINPTEYDSDADILYANIRGGGNTTTTDFFRISSLSSATPTIAAATITGATPGANAITHLKKSPHTANTLFLGLANGNLLKVTNANATPVGTAITAPVVGSVSCIEVGANENQLLVTFTNYGISSQVWETADGGATWRNKKGNLPDMPVRWALYNPNNRNQVILATEVGCWSTDNFDNGGTGTPVWGSSNASLANTRCDMMKYRASDGMVLIATHGRGMYTAFPFNTATPTITLSAAALTAFTSCAGSVSTEQSYTVTGANLTANISIVPPTGFEISTGTGGAFAATNPITLTQTGGNVATTTIYVRQSAAAANGSSGNISHTSTGATTQNKAIPTSTVNATSTPTVSISPTTAVAGSQTFTATAANVAGGTVAYDFQKNAVSQQNSAATTWNATGLVAGDVVRCVITVTGGTCLTATTATSNTVTVTAAPTPTITLSAAALTAFTSCAGSVSAEQQYTVTGANLTANISIVPPTGFEISTGTGGAFAATNPITLTQTGGNVATTTIYVRQSAAAANGANGNITHTSTGATQQDKAIPASIVNALPAIGTQPTNQTICAGANTTFTVAATGAGLTYQWQEKVGAGAFANITNGGVYGGATTASLTLTGATAGMNTNQYQCIVSGTCTPAATSTAVTLTINALPTITTQPTAQSTCVTGNATFTVAATGAGLTYQWQEKVGAGAFANITNGGVYGGATTANLTLTGVTAPMNTNQYQCIVSGTCTPAATSNAVALTVTAGTAINTQPTNQAGCVGGTVNFTTAASGSGTVTYQWQEKVGAGAFANITNGGIYSGATTATLTLTGITAPMNTNQYQCIATSTCGNATSNTATLSINTATSVTTQPTAQTVCPTQNATFTVAGAGEGTVTYQWQEKVGAGAFANITNGGVYGGATTANLTLTGVTAGMNTNQYQCIVTATCGNVTSNAVALTVNPVPSITTQPTAQSACTAGNATFSVVAAGAGLTYQWQEKVGAGAFANITNGGVYGGATTANLTLTGVTIGMNTNQYQCIVSGTCTPAVTSNAVALTVTAGLTIGTQPTPQTVCATQNATFTVAATGSGITYQWQEKVGAGAFANITNGGVYGGATTASLTLTGVPVGMSTNQYQCVINSSCGNATSTAVALTVNAATTITTQPTAQTICVGNNATFTVAVTGAGVTYQWQEKVGAGAFANITNGGVYGGATSASLTLTNPAIGMSTNQYQCVITSSCGNSTSNAVALTINALPAIGTQPTNQTICSTGNATFTVAATGAGLTYQWQEKVGAGAFANITNGGVYSGATTASLTLTGVPIGMNTNQYQCIVSGTCTPAATSNTATLTVNAGASVTTQPTSQTVCATQNATFTVAATGTGLTYQWQEKVGAGAFANITNGGVYGGATTATLTLTGVTAGMNTNQYQCVITAGCGSLNSNAVALTVNTAPTIGTQPTPQTVCANATATFTVAATGAGLTYQWQEKVGAGAFANITNGGVYGGATTATLTLTNPAAAMSTNQYQCIVSGTCTPAATSTAVALTVTPVNATPTLNALTAVSLAVSAPAQTVNLTGIGMGTGDTGQTLTVTATSSNLALIPNPTVTYTSANATGSISFTPIANQSGTATITVTVTDNGGTACGAVNTLSRTFLVDVGTPPPPPPARREQTITFAAIADREFINVPFGVPATASSNLPVTITVTSGNATINGQTLTLTGIGDITLTATQAGNNEYLAATPVSRTFKVTKATPSITFAAITDRAWNSGSFGISVSGTTGQPTVAVTQGQTIATLANNNTVNLNAAVGQVTITASLAETPTYNAVSVSRSFAVTKANQQINFPSLSVLRAGTTETLQATASSNLPITYTVVSGNATVTGNTLNVTNAAASIVVSASQAGNDLWNAATTVTQTIQVLKVEQTVSLNASVSPTISLGQSQIVNVTSSSNLPITIRVITGTATINGLTITPTSTGLVVVEIVQLGNDVFNASQPIRLAFNVLPTIALANVNVTGTVCAGAELTVGYTTNGNFAAGNYFTLELSDEEGNFNGSSLGGQEGLGSGSFKLPIPRSLNKTGSRYRVRVVAYPSNVMSNSSNTFTINTLPAQPFITLNTDGKTLSSTSSTGNQWYLAGIPIAAATGQTFTPTQTGSYTLIVTQNGCASIESPAYFYQLPTPTGINDDNLAAGLSLFPNPTENKFVLEGTVEKAGVVTLKLADALGRILTEEKVSTNGVQLKAEINLADYGAGVYFLTIESNGKTAIKRIIRH